MPIDPVCGMDVDEKNAAEKTEYQGQAVYFCSTECKKQFEDSPQEYIRQSA